MPPLSDTRGDILLIRQRIARNTPAPLGLGGYHQVGRYTRCYSFATVTDTHNSLFTPLAVISFAGQSPNTPPTSNRIEPMMREPTPHYFCHQPLTRPRRRAFQPSPAIRHATYAIAAAPSRCFACLAAFRLPSHASCSPIAAKVASSRLHHTGAFQALPLVTPRLSQ